MKTDTLVLRQTLLDSTFLTFHIRSHSWCYYYFCKAVLNQSRLYWDFPSKSLYLQDVGQAISDRRMARHPFRCSLRKRHETHQKLMTSSWRAHEKLVKSATCPVLHCLIFVLYSGKKLNKWWFQLQSEDIERVRFPHIASQVFGVFYVGYLPSYWVRRIKFFEFHSEIFLTKLCCPQLYWQAVSFFKHDAPRGS